MVGKVTVADMEAELRAILACEVHVQTNQGTYGADEACRKVGSGDPAFANREVYETVGGKFRSTGPMPDDAPGRMRHINASEMAEKRARCAELRRMIREAKK